MTGMGVSIMLSDIAIGVVGHIDRQRQIRYLTREINPEVIEVDDGTLGAAGNHAATLLALSRTDADWLVLLEDDALPVKNFRYQIGQALEVAPSHLVSFYLGTGYPQQWQGRIVDALREDTCWIMCDRLLHGVCYAVHHDRVDSLVVRIMDLSQRRYGTDDAISKWALENGVPVSYSSVSQVDHEDSASVHGVRYALGHPTHPRNRPRHAHKVGICNTWTASACTMGR